LCGGRYAGGVRKLPSEQWVGPPPVRDARAHGHCEQWRLLHDSHSKTEGASGQAQGHR
ncbi:hypothetical protein AVEN_275271-1, partial [Araneus ventricosus]